MRRSRQSKFPKRRGASLIEFMMVIPLLIGFAAAVYHFSWVMGTKQRLRMVGRQSAWHVARSGYWPSEDGAPWLSDAEIDDPYMLDRPVAVRQVHADGIHGIGENVDSRAEPPTFQTMEDLAENVAEVSDRANGLADSVLRPSDHSYHAGTVIELSVNIPSVVGLWSLLDMDMVGLYGREGYEWRSAPQGSTDNLLEAAQEEFLGDLEAALKSVPSPGDGLAEVFNGYCIAAWADPDGSD